MSVKWIKDVDSGELFPIVDEEEEFNIPEHLLSSEHTAIGIVAWFEFDSKIIDNQKLAVLVQKSAS